MRHQEPLAKMADMWRERCHKAERERDLARRDYECMNKFREHAEAQRDQLREALVAAVNYVPGLGDVPGIQAALKTTEEG